MYTGKYIKEKRSAETLMTMLVALAIAALFMMSFTNSAFAQGSEVSIRGQVVAVDSYDRTVMVRSIEPAPYYFVTFSTDLTTSILMCNQPKIFDFIKSGDKVTVTYHETNGRLYADSIDISAPLVACLYE